jgi:phage terminase small subunit
MKLNPKQEAFCQGVASGLSLTQAYVKAGYSEKGADGAACKLQGNASVAFRIDELRAKTEAKMSYKRETYLETLRDRFMEMPPESATCAKYGEMLAKAMGWNEPEKVDLYGLIDINVKIGGN